MKKHNSLTDGLSISTAYLPCLQSIKIKGIYTGLALAFVLVLSTTAAALKPNNFPLQAQLQIRPSVDDIARQINQQPKWRVLEAGPTVEGKKNLYRFKLLDRERGSVKVFIIDPTDPLFKNLHLDKP